MQSRVAAPEEKVHQNDGFRPQIALKNVFVLPDNSIMIRGDLLLPQNHQKPVPGA